MQKDNDKLALWNRVMMVTNIAIATGVWTTLIYMIS